MNQDKEMKGWAYRQDIEEAFLNGLSLKRIADRVSRKMENDSIGVYQIKEILIKMGHTMRPAIRQNRHKFNGDLK